MQRGDGGFQCVLLTTQERKGILAERKEAERLEKGASSARPPRRISSRPSSSDRVSHLRAAQAAARALQKAVGVDGELIAHAEKLDEELKEEKKEARLPERRQGAAERGGKEELADAVEAARTRARGATRAARRRGGDGCCSEAARQADQARDEGGRLPCRGAREAKALKAELDELEKARKAAEIEDARKKHQGAAEREAASKGWRGGGRAHGAQRGATRAAGGRRGGDGCCGEAARQAIKRAKRSTSTRRSGRPRRSRRSWMSSRRRARRPSGSSGSTRSARRRQRAGGRSRLIASRGGRQGAQRARKAVNVSPELLAQGDGLKAACDDEKRQAAASGQGRGGGSSQGRGGEGGGQGQG